MFVVFCVCYVLCVGVGVMASLPVYPPIPSPRSPAYPFRCVAEYPPPFTVLGTAAAQCHVFCVFFFWMLVKVIWDRRLASQHMILSTESQMQRRDTDDGQDTEH